MEGVKLNLSRLGGGESGEGKERGVAAFVGQVFIIHGQ